MNLSQFASIIFHVHAPNQSRPKMSSSKGDRIKLAIQPQPSMPPKQPLLLDFEQDSPLTEIIKDVCGRWGVDQPELYAFMYADPPGQSRKLGYVSEENRFDLADGDILRVELTPKRLAEKMHRMLSSEDPKELNMCFEQLPSFARDSTFAGEFVRTNGLSILIGMIEKAHFHTDDNVLRLNAMLTSFEEIMEHNIVPWNTVTETFISKVISLVVTTRSHDLVRAPVLGRCFSILCSILANQQHADLILRNILVEQVIPFLSNRSELVQQNVLAFVNGMLLTGKNVPAMFQQLREKKYGKIIQSDVIEKKTGSSALSRELSHQLYVYQQLLLNQYEESMNQAFTKGLTEHEQGLLYLQQAIPEEFTAGRPPSTLTPMNDQIWRQLGFSGQNPYSDLAEVPPGILALNFMIYFARNKRDTFVRLLLANKDNPCPFAQASIRLTKMLCQIFKVGEAPNDVAVGCLQPLVGSDSPFEELFCVAIQLLYKTWREMRAAELDFEKVMTVVEKQVTTVIHQSQGIGSFENLRQKFFELSYKKIVSASVEKSQMLDESIWKAQPVVQLKEAVTPEIRALIKQQRLRHLVEGDFFPNVKTKSKKSQTSFYCRLSPNLKVLHFGDAEESASRPSLDALKSKIPVSDMRLVIGKDCPHVKDKAVKGRPDLAFSIYHGSDEHLDFLPQDDMVFSIWVDGLSVLCGQEMPSRQAEDDLNTLLVMEMKLRLLDVENIPIPSEPPTIPPDPPNYDFHYKLD